MTLSKTIVIATHRRSGTHWTIDALRNNSPDINNKFLTLEQIDPSHAFHIPLDDFQTELDTLEGHALIKTHDLPSATSFDSTPEREFTQELMQNSPVIYVHRDGRDVMVSLYYYMKSFSESVAEISFSEFLRMDTELTDGKSISRPAYWAHHIQTWLNHPNSIAISYKSLESEYENTLRDMAQFLDIQLFDKLSTIDVHQNQKNKNIGTRVLKKLGLERGKTSSAVSPRKGKSGDWRNHFSEDDLAFFLGEAGEVMRQLVYVTNH